MRDTSSDSESGVFEIEWAETDSVVAVESVLTQRRSRSSYSKMREPVLNEIDIREQLV